MISAATTNNPTWVSSRVVKTPPKFRESNHMRSVQTVTSSANTTARPPSTIRVGTRAPDRRRGLRRNGSAGMSWLTCRNYLTKRQDLHGPLAFPPRSEERRVGKEVHTLAAEMCYMHQL